MPVLSDVRATIIIVSKECFVYIMMYDVEHEYCSCCVAEGMWMLSAVSP